MRVGVPRALWYYRHFLPWRAFLENLGAEVVVSPPANRATLEAGLAYTIPETCLPLKLFFGHVRALIGQCDALLAPSIERYAPGATNCAKLIGLPDMLRATMCDLPPLIDPAVDLSEGPRGFVALALRVGRAFTHNPMLIRDAALAALEAHRQARADLAAARITPADFSPSQSRGSPFPQPHSSLTIAIVGHPYNLYDPFANHNLLMRMTRLGAEILTPERLGPIPGADYWTFEYEFVGAAQAAVAQNGINGLLAVLAFGCGPDAVMVEQVRQTAIEAGVPVMTLTLDEHTGEAGLVTRLEAFVDMLFWRRRRDGRVPGH
jgi:predicted nucleotide-binding protein (sugar kinase/HSP70/actin superfamily)